MSDPLSVAGTAVGITSLGIQVCQGLVQYLRAVRGRKEDIRDGIRDIEQVVSLLYSLNSLLPNVNTEADTAPLRSCLNNCYEKLETLQEVLGELGDAKHSSKVTRRAANVMRSVTYPFQQEKLIAIRQSLRSVLNDLNLIISIISLTSEATIQSTVTTISLDLKSHTSTHASSISDLQIQIDSNFVQLRSLQSTILATLDNIAEQLHQTQLYIRDLDQRVDGKLTIIESGTRSIQDSNQVTAARLEEMTQVLVSNMALVKTMAVQINSIQSSPTTGFTTAKQETNSEEDSGRALRRQSVNTGLWQGCYCAASLPKSRTSFRIWNMKFELEQQEHHLPSCKLWGTKKGTKRTAKATFALKMAWLSARMTIACFQYASGTSRPGLSIECKNIVERHDSPVYKLIFSLAGGIRDVTPAEQIIRSIELLERGVLALYMDGHASPGDIDSNGRTHAEMVFEIFTWSLMKGQAVNRILQDNRLTHTLISCLKTLLQAYNSDKDVFCFSTTLTSVTRDPDPFQDETINTKYFLSFMSQQSCFSFSPYLVLYISTKKPSKSLKEIIHEASELSPITKAILSRKIEDLKLCVTKDPNSVSEPVFCFNVLYLSAAWSEGLKYLMTTDANSLIDDPCYNDDGRKQTPVTRALALNEFDSVDILLGAGCFLDTDAPCPSFYNCPSGRMHATLAAHMAARRAQLLDTVQQQLGLFLSEVTLAFADGAAAEICAAFDASQILVHPSLRVNPGYKSIYSHTYVPLNAFNYFWDIGFNCPTGHNLVGLTPIMSKQHRWVGFGYSSKDNGLMEALYWLVEKGFMQEKATDPLGLGLNICATGYHYLGALFAGYTLGQIYDFHFISEIHPVLSQASEDDCECWCNAEGHGCSPTKLFLITYLHQDLKWGTRIGFYQSGILHHELFDNVSGSDRLSTLIMETLRLLTFEALEMTHTCCYFDGFYRHDPCNLVYGKGTMGDREIFCHDPVSVSKVRSCAVEQSRAALLEELMAEFTEQLHSISPGPDAFKRFIYTYWRRRISSLYEPNSNAVEGLLQHQTFQGFGVSHTVRTGVLPEALERLLGENFLSSELDALSSLEDLFHKTIGYDPHYRRWVFWDELRSDDGSELDKKEEDDDESD